MNIGSGKTNYVLFIIVIMIIASLSTLCSNIEHEAMQSESKTRSVSNEIKWGGIQELSYPNGNEDDTDPIMVEYNSELYVIWATWGDEFSTGTDWDIVYRTYDGNSWSSIQELTSPTDTGNDARPYGTVYNDELYIIWATNDPSISDGTDWDIVIRSFNGSDWSSITEVTLTGDNGGGLIDYYPQIEVYNGNLYAIWMSEDDSITNGTDEDIVVRSYDGISWGAIEELTLTPNTDTDLIPLLQVYKNELYAIWYTYDNTIATDTTGNVVMRVFNGTEWNNTFQISTDCFASQNLRPDAIIFQDKLFVVWQNIAGICYKSYDGSSWSAAIMSVETTGPLEELEFPKIAEYNDNLYVTYEIMASVSANSNIAIIEYNGTNWTEPVNISFESNNGDDLKPAILNYSKQLYVAWYTNGTELGDGTDFDIVIRDYDEIAPDYDGLSDTTDMGTGNKVLLQWNNTSDSSSPITYNIYISTNASNFNLSSPSYTTQNLNYTISGLDNGVEYYFVVRAEDSRGNEENNTIMKSAIPTTPVDSTPPQFDGLSQAVNLDLGGQIFLNWSTGTEPNTVESNSDPSLPITYNIYMSTTSGGQNFSNPINSTQNLNYTITGLMNDTQYFFVVRAEDAAGNEDNNTIELNATPTGPPIDTDGDGIPDATDTDDDNDGTPDTTDKFPLDPTETSDFDEDGIGDNADPDDDNDGEPDVSDAFQFDPSEWSDLDGDGIGDNEDPDDDNDGILDVDEGKPPPPDEYERNYPLLILMLIVILAMLLFMMFSKP